MLRQRPRVAVLLAPRQLRAESRALPGLLEGFSALSVLGVTALAVLHCSVLRGDGAKYAACLKNAPPPREFLYYALSDGEAAARY